MITLLMIIIVYLTFCVFVHFMVPAVHHGYNMVMDPIRGMRVRNQLLLLATLWILAFSI